ncbi:copper transporter [Caldisalinibacter kiritimatiensis]|uniref:Copper transporter n=1 Tax=Caldisalinibacter kiritimatiensis TaxID=1304284 RepID=R1CP50_9FIRM|nr:copper transporter [Caldisalinibacter kiritimatiensis]EOD00466.1 hypothetical protein L21TH_1486 [Caldisalinibacter kiritimatiensis]
MIINIRYYVLTITSIFLALGIGIIIGFMFDAQEIMVSQKQDIVNQLEEKFEYLKDENNTLKSNLKQERIKNKKYEKISEDLLPLMAKGKLDKMSYAVIDNNNIYKNSEISNLLELSGANIKSITLIEKRTLDNLVNFIYKSSDTHVDVSSSFAKLLVNTLKDMNYNNEFFSYLLTNNIIHIKEENTKPLDFIILTENVNLQSKHKINSFNESIIDYCSKLKLPIIYVKKDSTENINIDIYKNGKIDTINNISSYIGKITLLSFLYEESLKQLN